MKKNKFKLLKKLDRKKKEILYHHYTKYITDYKIEGDNIRIYSSIGGSRLVKNTKENQAKLNRVIVQSKIDIAGKIDKYEKTSSERLLVLLLNIAFLSLSGMFIPLTFFIGNYVIFLLSIIIFSFATLTTSIITLDYYFIVKEVSHLKMITGYKKESEINLPWENILKTK